MATTKIEWCDEVWNPVWGCLNDCPYCYARKIAKRFGKTEDQRNFIPVFMRDNFERKFKSTTKRVFINSMSDPYYWEIQWLDRAFVKIDMYPEIDFIFLTKHLLFYTVLKKTFLDVPENLIVGVTAEKSTDIEAINTHTNNRRLLNVEPILGTFGRDIKPKLMNFDWLIIGGETGNRKDRVIPTFDMYENLISAAKAMNIPYFIKPSLKDITPPELYLQQFPGRS